jgi:1-acyl-sn-glycerol-3-phosphate acyltransferase
MEITSTQTLERSEPLAYRMTRQVALGVLRTVGRLEIAGIDHVPLKGPLIMAPNHLHALDAWVIASVIPRKQTVIAADKWQGTVAGAALSIVADAIYIARGEPDREALAKALEVLKRGGCMTVAPEGTRSRTGGLLQGKNGPVYLASRSGAPIVPIVAWGQEKALGRWQHLQRAEFYVRIGAPIYLPSGAERARSAELNGYTHELMLAMARMLPPEYRGIYAAATADAP